MGSKLQFKRRLGISDLEKHFGVHRQTIRRWVKAGKFPRPHYHGQRRKWFESEIIQWEREHSDLPSTEEFLKLVLADGMVLDDVCLEGHAKKEVRRALQELKKGKPRKANKNCTDSRTDKD